jgi:hypothetical protein
VIVWVTSVRHLGGHRLMLRFSDGLQGEVDLSDCLSGPIFEPLRDPAFFALARVDTELDTVTWPNGADFSPEYLHECVRASASEVAEPSPESN